MYNTRYLLIWATNHIILLYTLNDLFDIYFDRTISIYYRDDPKHAIWYVFWQNNIYLSATEMTLDMHHKILIEQLTISYLICVLTKQYLLIYYRDDPKHAIWYVFWQDSIYLSFKYCPISFLELLNGLVIEHMFLTDFFARMFQ